MDLYNLVLSAKLIKGEGGGGGDIDVDPLTVTENGVYSASSGHAYSPVTVSVPQSGITPTGTKSIDANGVYDVTDFASANVSVPTGVFPSGTSAITSNGIYDITDFASVDVNVSGGGGGDHDAEDALIMRTLSGAYENSRVTSIGSYAFQSCHSLTTASFPNATSINGSVFYGCSLIAEMWLPKVSIIGARAFAGCSNLMSVYLLNNSVIRLAQGNEFDSTPIKVSSYTGSFGSIYVPASLVDSYKSGPYWSVISDRITAYEGE